MTIQLTPEESVALDEAINNGFNRLEAHEEEAEMEILSSAWAKVKAEIVTK